MALELHEGFTLRGNIAVPTATTIGISGGGHIEFDDQATDEINFIDCKVGIGTDAPGELLDVDGFIQTSGIKIITNAGREVQFTGTGTGNIHVNNAGSQLYISTNGGNLNLGGTSDASHLVIQSNGKVRTSTQLGVGIVPTQTLDINGNCRIAAASSYRIGTAGILSGVANVLIGSGGATGTVTLQSTTGSAKLNGAHFELTGDCKLGANGRLHVGSVGTVGDCTIKLDSDFNTGLYWPSADNLGLVAGGTEQIRLDGVNDLVGVGVTPTLKLDVNAKSGMSAIGGICIKLTNTTGAVTVQGQTVKADPATDDAVILTAADDNECIGVFLEAGIADDAEAWVVVGGIADVLMGDNEAATAGNWVETNQAEAGYADATSASPAAAPQHFNEIGHCIETVAATGAGTHILARCVLHFN